MKRNIINAWGYGDEPHKEPFRYTACGLDNVFLISGYEPHDEGNGEVSITIKDQDRLHEAIGRFLIGQKKILTGKELRFLRVEMDLTQSELGRLVGYNSQQVARWEKEQNRITGPADRLLRMLYKEHLGSSVKIRELLEEVDEMDACPGESQLKLFSDAEFGWRWAA
jgi:DNA-binding transcriptional regulator YiaG